MKKVVSFSGGDTSRNLCAEMIHSFGRENVDFIFMDTGAEHPKTYEFIKAVNKELNLNLTCLQADFDQPLGEGHSYKIVPIESLKYDLKVYEDLVSKYGTPGVTSAWCTSRMKEETHDKYCDEKYGKYNYETWIGLRADEPKRVWGDHNQFKHSIYKQLKAYGFDDLEMTDIWNLYSREGLKNRQDAVDEFSIDLRLAGMMAKRFFESSINKQLRYMCEISPNEKLDVAEFSKTQSSQLGIEEWNGNCVFCFKKSDLKLAAAAKDNPELYSEWLGMIERAPEREGQKRKSRHVMYRKNRTIEQVIATFDGSTGQEIKARIRGSKMIDTNSCSESCEVFNQQG